MTKHELCAQVWPEQFISDATLGSTVRAVRQAIGDTGEAQELIRTIHGQGYRCVAPVTVCTELRVASTPGAAAGAALQVPEAAERSPLASAQSATPPAQLCAPSTLLREGERKVVTVLCYAVVLSSPARAQLDLDALHRLMRAVYEGIRDTVRRYEGTLQASLGERGIAVFGAPIAHEDHAVRAGYAALAIQQRLDDWQRSTKLPVDEGVSVRVGLHTGVSVVGGLGGSPERRTTLVGDVPLTAIALREQAVPGTIYCSAATARLLQGAMSLTPVGSARSLTSARSEPVYRLFAGHPPHWPGDPQHGPVLSPFVGREREVTTLNALLARAEAGQGQVVGIVGEAGMGKSRLVMEFSHCLGGRPLTYLRGRCLSYGSTTPYLPVIELLRHHGGLTEAEAPQDSMVKLQRCLQAWGVTSEVAPVLLHLLGLRGGTDALTSLSPAARKTVIVTTLTQLCLQASRQQPLVLELENLHWIDASTGEWLATLVDQMMRVPLLLVGTYRPGYRPGWCDKSYVTQMALQPLTAQESLQVVRAVLPTATPTAPLVSSLLAKAEGNPFFLEELARMVFEQGDGVTDLPMPDTVQAVLSARIDRLPTAAKQLLQTAAVLGRKGPVRLVEAVWKGADEAAVLLQELMRRELLDLRMVRGERCYVFKHALTQEVAYASLLTSHRQALHAAASQALEDLDEHRLEDVADRLAHHDVQAGDADEAVASVARVAENAAGGQSDPTGA